MAVRLVPLDQLPRIFEMPSLPASPATFCTNNVFGGGVSSARPSVSHETLLPRFHRTRASLKVSPQNVVAAHEVCVSRLTCKVGRYGGRPVSAASVDAGQVETTDALESSKKISKVCRPCVILPGLGNNTTDYDALVADLESRGVSATVVRVARVDWLRNAAGLLDGNYWKGTLSPRPVLNWYLDRVRIAIEAARGDSEGDGKVSLIGHSAGGWLARVYMAEFGTEDIGLLLTLGTPHLPPPRGVPGVFDQTRGLLYHVENTSPGAFHAPDVKYVCIAGRYLKGRDFGAEKTPPVASTGVGTLDLEEVAGREAQIAVDPEQAATVVQEAPPRFRERFVGAGYKQVCGKADVWGDGVVPEESAYLEGAINIGFEGVYHSPVGSSSERPWYGTPEILDRWVHHLFDDE
ncbi:hypothetical protein R1sor_017164 [Riccia sorocarpa]|uniref:GPI inositol-deacylase n=1 Tax=Riccia sorocarpa TaxID=122646 RepID=A0ABD3I8T3_9MARC